MKTILKSGWGFDVGQNFARATVDTPIEVAVKEYAKPGCVIGYIAEDPKSNLGFLRHGTNGKVRVHCRLDAVKEVAEGAK